MYRLFRCVFLILLVHFVKTHHVAERALLFPQYTVLQFTYGASAQAILPNRSIQFSICVQANFDLPYNISNFVPTVIMARKRNDYDISKESLFEYAVDFMRSFGLDGETCLFRSICEIFETPMHLRSHNSLLENIVHYVLMPSLDVFWKPTEKYLNIAKVAFTRKLLEAEHIGKSIGNCDRYYSGCEFSLLDMFTTKMKQN